MTTTQTQTQTEGELVISKTETFDIDFALDILKNGNLSKDDKETLQRYVKARVRGNQVEVVYKLCKDKKSIHLGRLYPNKWIGLQNIQKDIRAALAGSKYWDIDTKNGCYTLITQLCRSHNLATPCMDRYVEERDEILDDTAQQLDIPREEAKQKIAAILFGGSTEGLTTWLSFLGKEVKGIAKTLFKLYEKELKFLNGAPNIQGKGMSWIYQTEERKVILALDRALCRRGRSLDVLIHDGGLVRKKDGETELPQSLLRECEADIEKETGYKIRLVMKPMITSFVRKSENVDDEYARKKEQWENVGWKGDIFFKLRHPPCYIAMNLDTGEWCRMTRSDLTQLEEDNQLSDGTRFVNRWLEDPDKREYDRMVFRPGLEVSPREFNIFRGFAIKPVEGDWSLMKELLMLCVNEEQGAYDWVENWLASLFQKPHQKTQVCIINQGRKGACKDTFWGLVLDMIGKTHSFNTSTPEHNLFARFNSSIANKLLNKIEEGNFQVNKANEDIFKALITSETINLEQKGHDSITMDNLMNFVMTTNHEVPILISDDERRFAAFKASDKRVGDIPYWTSVYKRLETEKEKILSAYMYHLLNKDIKDFCPRPAYKTQYYYDIAQTSIPYHARFFQQQIELNDCTELTWDSATLLREIQNKNPKFEITPTKLGIVLRDIYGDVVVKRRMSKGYEYSFNCSKLTALLMRKGWWVDY